MTSVSRRAAAAASAPRATARGRSRCSSGSGVGGRRGRLGEFGRGRGERAAGGREGVEQRLFLEPGGEQQGTAVELGRACASASGSSAAVDEGVEGAAEVVGQAGQGARRRARSRRPPRPSAAAASAATLPAARRADGGQRAVPVAAAQLAEEFVDGALSSVR